MDPIGRSHGGNLYLLHAVNRPLRGASVNLDCSFLRSGTLDCQLTLLPGLCQPCCAFLWPALGRSHLELKRPLRGATSALGLRVDSRCGICRERR